MMRAEPVLIDTSSADRKGRLIFRDDLLVAVIVCISPECGDDALAGRWHVEAHFCKAHDLAPIFSSVDEAMTYFRQH